MYKLEKTFTIAVAHQLRDTKSLVTKKCAQNIHGHNLVITIIITTNKLVDDMVIDFGKIKEIVNKLDHKNLNDIFEFNPTAENIAKYLYDIIEKEYVKLLKHELIEESIEVIVEESPGAKITCWE